jgi:hypothetical protein
VPRFFSQATFIFTLLFVLTPVGICPCWINPNLETYHPHLTDQEVEHDHGILNQMSQGNSLPVVLPFLVPPALLWTALMAGSIWRSLFPQRPCGNSLVIRPLPPPQWLLAN